MAGGAAADEAGGGAAAAAAAGRTPRKVVGEVEEVADVFASSSQALARGAACTPTAAPSAASSAAERSV